jgi:hypothetical protein
MAIGSLWAGDVTSGRINFSSVSAIYSYILGHVLTLSRVEHGASRLLRNTGNCLPNYADW